jgi:serine O-acetyltransferase
MWFFFAELRAAIASDLYRYRGRASRSDLVSAFIYEPGFRYMFYLRKAAYYHRRRISFIIPLIYNRAMLKHYRHRYGFQLSPNTRIGRGLYLGHFGVIIVNSNAVLGDNVNLAPGVVIGQANRGKRKGIPTVGNRVWIGANAVVVGDIRVSDDALIGPGAYVNFDVPERAVVMGNPGSIVSYSGTEEYVCNLAPSALQELESF